MRFHKLFFVIFVAAISLFVGRDSFASGEEIPGGYIIVFVQNESVAIFEGEDRVDVVTLMLDMQKSYLERKYGLKVEKTYSSISLSSGKGMLFARSSNKVSLEESKKILEMLNADPMIESAEHDHSVSVS